MDTETNIHTTLDQPPEDSVPKGKGARKKMLTVIAVILGLFAVGFGIWFIWLREDAPKASSQTNNTTNNEAEPKGIKPFALAYKTGDIDTDVEVRLSQLDTNKSELARKLSRGSYVQDARVYKEKVALVVSANVSAGAETVAVWYSDDSGQSYEKIFASPPVDEDEQWAQITSLSFSSDGKSIVIGYLPQAGGDNTVKEINPGTKQATDIFSTPEAGVFIHGFNRSTKQVYYYKGCYNCDGNKMNRLLMWNPDKEVEVIVHEDAARIGVQTVFKEDLSKALILKMDPNEDGISWGSEGIINEVDVASGRVREIIPPLDEGGPMGGDLGYMEGEYFIYFSKGKVLYQVGDNNSTSVMYDADAPIVDVHYASETRAIVSTGDIGNFTVVDFDLASQKTKPLLEGQEDTFVFGTTWK